MCSMRFLLQWSQCRDVKGLPYHISVSMTCTLAAAAVELRGFGLRHIPYVLPYMDDLLPYIKRFARFPQAFAKPY